MFDSLYHYPFVLARHRECPSAEDRGRFLAHCASLDTTNVYAETDRETKAQALAKCDITSGHKTTRRRTNDPELMAFLRSL